MPTTQHTAGSRVAKTNRVPFIGMDAAYVNVYDFGPGGTAVGGYIHVTPWFFEKRDRATGEVVLGVRENGSKFDVLETLAQQTFVMYHELARFYLGADDSGTIKDVIKWDSAIKYLSARYDEIQKKYPPK